MLHMRRAAVLQRCKAVLLDRFIYASRHGEELSITGHGTYTAEPRITLYVADHPEKPHLLGLRLNKCFKPCSLCVVSKENCGTPNAKSSTRVRTENLELQLEAAALCDRATGTNRRDEISRDYSALPFLPALAAVHGQGTGSMHIYKLFGFDLLYVSSALMLMQMAVLVTILWANIVFGVLMDSYDKVAD